MDTQTVYGLLVLYDIGTKDCLLFGTLDERENHLGKHIYDSYRLFDYDIERIYFGCDMMYFFNN